MDSTIDQEAADQRKRDQIKNSMNNLDDPIACDLIISIIRLVEFICREASSNTQNELFYEISAALNDSENSREQALFNCLEIPNDDVKLAVVKCLFVINIEDIDSSEIS